MRDLLLEELAMFERIVRDGLEVVPRFRVLTAGGEYVIFAPLSDDLAERRRTLQMIGAFMAGKLAQAFVMSAEIEEPDAIVAIAVSRDGREGVLQKIARNPLGFGAPRWLDAAAVDPEVVALLPGRETVLDAETLQDLERAFVPGGEFATWRVC
jgi:hypothetical protein